MFGLLVTDKPYISGNRAFAQRPSELRSRRGPRSPPAGVWRESWAALTTMVCGWPRQMEACGWSLTAARKRKR
jgi:hypothetical protein